VKVDHKRLSKYVQRGAPNEGVTCKETQRRAIGQGLGGAEEKIKKGVPEPGKEDTKKRAEERRRKRRKKLEK